MGEEVMAKCYGCGYEYTKREHWQIKKGQIDSCPACGNPVKYSCNGCGAPIIPKEMTKDPCSNCSYWVCPDCGTCGCTPPSQYPIVQETWDGLEV